MFKSLLTGACLAAMLAGCASAPQKPADKTAAASTTCLATGSRIPLSPGDCAALGQSYSGDDLRQTGQFNPGAALRMLDPAVR
jgi:hypothetical protein